MAERQAHPQALTSLLAAFRNHVVNTFTPPPAKSKSKQRKGGKR